MRKKYKYQVGEVVNESLKIVERIQLEVQYTRKGVEGSFMSNAYIVQSLAYPDAPVYRVREVNLVNGFQDSYKAGRRVYIGNSLYNIEHIRPYLVDTEEAKTITPSSNKKILTKCPNCNRRKRMSPNKLTSRPYSCSNCSKGTSYPELFMMAYLEVKGIKYEYQKTYEDLPNRRFDFYTEEWGIIETHGLQHYKNSTNWNSLDITIQSDKEKQEYCKENSIPYIEIDARESSFTFIRDNINRSILPSITKEEQQLILKHIESNKRYPVKEIVKLYKEGKSTIEIGKIYNIDKSTVRRLLKKLNTPRRKEGRQVGSVPHNRKKVKCVNTKEIFSCSREACEYYGLNIRTGIASVCSGKRNYAGTYKGMKLQWEYVD